VALLSVRRDRTSSCTALFNSIQYSHLWLHRIQDYRQGCDEMVGIVLDEFWPSYADFCIGGSLKRGVGIAVSDDCKLPIDGRPTGFTGA
jgi:hypothetical protein